MPATAENVAVIRQLWADFVESGEVALDLHDEKVEVNDHDIPESGSYRGHEGVLRWLEEWGSAWSEWSAEPKEFIDAGDRVIVVFDITAIGKGSGIEITREDAIVYGMRDGKIAAIDYFNSKQRALEFAAG